MAKSKGGNTISVVTQLVEPVLAQLELRLWDVRFEKEGPDYFLRIFIDRDTPLDMQACEAATRAINPVIDEADPISQAYYLEVGSPGLGRRLTKDAHFEAMQGREIMCSLYHKNENGDKEVRGILLSKDANAITVSQNDTQTTILLSDVSFSKLCDDDDLF